MCSLIFITITALHLTYPYVASENFSGTVPDQDVESFLQLIVASTFWNELKTNFNTRFSEGRFKLDHQLEVEQCWLDDMEKGISNARQNAERATRKRQQKQRYMDYNPRGLKTKYIQMKAQEQLIDCPNATWKDISTQKFQEDVMLQVCSNFLHDVEQIKIELATMRQEMRNLRTEGPQHQNLQPPIKLADESVFSHFPIPFLNLSHFVGLAHSHFPIIFVKCAKYLQLSSSTS